MRRVSFFSQIMDVLAPRLCYICDDRLSSTEHTLCAACNLHMMRTHFDQSFKDNIFIRYFWNYIPLERGVAWFFFEPHSKAARPIYQIKYGGDPMLARSLGRMYAREIVESGFFDGIDLLLPVPLTWSRQWKRGYNQSRMICEGISEITGIAVETRALRRNVFQESQTKKNWWERRANVEGVFCLRHADRIRGKHILIVDDIMTTGATISECGMELLKAGNVRLSALTLGMTRS